MRPTSYDLIDEAYKRSLMGSQRPALQANPGGGQGTPSAAPPAPGIQGAPQIGGQGVPDFFNRPQPGPAFQNQGGITPGQYQQPAGGGQPAPQQQGGAGGQDILTILASMLGGGQQGPTGYKPVGTTYGQRRQDSFQNQPPPWMALQGAPGAQAPEVQGIFEPGNFMFGNGAHMTPMLNEQVRRDALGFILQNLVGSMNGSA